MPVTDVNETKVKEFEICPILTQHFVCPFTNHIEPTLVVKILTQNAFGHRSACVGAPKEIDNGHNFFTC